MLLSELFNFIRSHLQFKVPVEVGVSDIPRYITVVPKYPVLKPISVMCPSFYVATIVCHLAPLLRRACGLLGE